MRILEIEKLFQNEETLDQVLEEIKEDIEKVDYWAQTLRSGVVDNPEEADRCLTEVTGAYSNLRTVLAIAESEKKNREVRFYNELKINTENESKKFVATSADKEASAHVAIYRRIRNIIQGYKEAAEKQISSMQTLIKDLIREKDTMQK